MNYNAILAEDIPATRREIAKLLEETGHFTVLAALESVHETIQAFYQHENDVEVLVLDITLMNGTAFDILKRLRADRVEIPPVIIITGNTTPEFQKQLAISKEEIVGYIHKPILDRWDQSINQCLTELSHFYTKREKQLRISRNDEKHSRLLVRHDHKIIPVDYSDIVYLTTCSDTKKTLICSSVHEQLLVDPRPCSHLEEMLPGDIFFRINMQYVVNARKITLYCKNDREISLKNGKTLQLTVSHRRVNALIEAMAR